MLESDIFVYIDVKPIENWDYKGDIYIYIYEGINANKIAFFSLYSILQILRDT